MCVKCSASGLDSTLHQVSILWLSLPFPSKSQPSFPCGCPEIPCLCTASYSCFLHSWVGILQGDLLGNSDVSFNSGKSATALPLVWPEIFTYFPSVVTSSCFHRPARDDSQEKRSTSDYPPRRAACKMIFLPSLCLLTYIARQRKPWRAVAYEECIHWKQKQTTVETSTEALLCRPGPSTLTLGQTLIR